MTDVSVVMLMVMTTIGALWGRSVPLMAAAVVLAAGWWWRKAWVISVGCLALASGLSAQASTGLSIGPHDQVHGVVTVLTDPAPVGSGQRLTIRVDGRHVEVVAHGGSGRKLAKLLAGDRVYLEGRIRAVPGAPGVRLAHRHIIGRLEVAVVGDHLDGAPVFRSANRVRRAIERGARVMSPAEQALFSGFVLGDDRAEPGEIVDEFRASGLSHLTAVSGENVAFLLVAAGPLLRRLSVRWRWVATVGLVGWFALLTRFEPSVLRASAMAVLSVTSWSLARPASTVRRLCLAGTIMLLLDPFLAYSVGWWLSVGATFGIALLAGPLALRIPGPRSLALALGVTIAAQIGVAPVQLAVFGGLPVVSVPANLLAVPAAGPVMVWGLPAGLLAGFLPRWAGVALHLPSRICIRWIALVAKVGAALPLGVLTWRHLVVIGVAVVCGWLWRRRPWLRRISVTVLGGAVLTSAVAAAALGAPAGPSRLSDQIRIWRFGTTVVVALDGRVPHLLNDLRRAHVDHIDALVVTSRAADVTDAARLFHPTLFLAPDAPRGAYAVGDATVEVTVFDGAIDVTVQSRAPVIAQASG